jgi:hypothetical protein
VAKVRWIFSKNSKGGGGGYESGKGQGEGKKGELGRLIVRLKGFGVKCGVTM